MKGLERCVMQYIAIAAPQLLNWDFWKGVEYMQWRFRVAGVVPTM